MIYKEANMSIHTISSRDFNQNTGLAKRLTEKGIVMITDRGEAAHVLMTYQDYLNLTQIKPATLVDLIAQEEDDFDFDVPRLGENTRETTTSLFKEIDFK